ncbi:hypothetical protein [Roseomonas indoligenes]|uniref:Uncharacterized protein n=1 Tax=Roseomonas indoligenes TaxID=2820811 RepID=A0A940MRL0_9PROT|nr:hypothetical protein [Pararoseomonas indoligenes]MBP0492184.1 hypothetical protein [Pararoseomonas indoligenes]
MKALEGSQAMKRGKPALTPASLWPSEKTAVLRKRALKEARTPPDLGQEVRDPEGKVVGAGSHRPIETTEIELLPAPGSKAAVKAIARRYTVECVLDAYNARGQLVDMLWRAGMMFRAQYRAATTRPKVTAEYGERGGKGSTAEAVDARNDAERKYLAALDALPVRMRAVVIGVCGEDEWASDRMRLLHEALRVLVDHYRIPADYCRKGS